MIPEQPFSAFSEQQIFALCTQQFCSSIEGLGKRAAAVRWEVWDRAVVSGFLAEEERLYCSAGRWKVAGGRYVECQSKFRKVLKYLKVCHFQNGSASHFQDKTFKIQGVSFQELGLERAYY